METQTKTRWPLSEKAAEMSMHPDRFEGVKTFIFLKIRDFS
jgi:hypothetical protein